MMLVLGCFPNPKNEGKIMPEDGMDVEAILVKVARCSKDGDSSEI
jgi:hypothetical protein